MKNKKVIRLTENDIEKLVRKILKEEDYIDGFKKPNMFQRIKKQGKDLMNIENKSDREILDNIHRMIDMGSVDNIRQHDNGVTAWVNNKALIVDKETPEIIISIKIKKFFITNKILYGFWERNL
jgi:hypothetical protein